MKTAVLSLFTFAVLGNAALAVTRTDKFFANLEGTIGDYHQSTVLLMTSPTGDPTDTKSHEKLNTASVKKLTNDKYVIQTFFKSEAADGSANNTSNSTVIERKADTITLTSYDLANPYQSVTATPNVADDDGTQLAYYQSDARYLDVSADAVAKRKDAFAQRHLSLSALVLVLKLAGESVPAEVTKSEDWLNALVVMKGAANPLAITEILLDPLGKSVRNPKGEPSLTVVQAFHSEE